MSQAVERPIPAPVFLPLREFLRAYGISKTSFYRRAALGNMPPVVKIGRSTLVPVAAADEWFAARIQPAIEISRAAHRIAA